MDKSGNIGCGLAVFVSVFGAGAIAFVIALKTFWWCPQGGCSLAKTEAKVHLLANVGGWSVLFLALATSLWFVSAAIFRAFYPLSTAEKVFLSAQGIKLPAWYKRLMQRWLMFLWS